MCPPHVREFSVACLSDSFTSNEHCSMMGVALVSCSIVYLRCLLFAVLFIEVCLTNKVEV